MTVKAWLCSCSIGISVVVLYPHRRVVVVDCGGKALLTLHLAECASMQMMRLDKEIPPLPGETDLTAANVEARESCSIER